MRDAVTIFVEDGVWRFARVEEGEVVVRALPEGDEATAASRAAAAARVLGEQGEVAAVLALPSSWCLCAVIPTDGLERSGRRRAMGFRLEEHLPISAEQMVADYVEPSRGEALGVCAEVETLRPVVEALESGGVAVRAICPAALLAASDAAARHAGAGVVVVVGDGGSGGEGVDAAVKPSFDVVETRRGGPAAWWWFADDPEGVRGRLVQWRGAQGGGAPVVVLGRGAGASDAAAAAEGGDHHHVAPDPRSPDEAAAWAAAAVARETVTPWVNLRRDALAPPDRLEAYRKPAAALVLAVVALLAVTIAVAQWRAAQYERQASALLAQQVEAFEAALPDQANPGAANIKRRLASERQKLAGQAGRGVAGAGADPLREYSALVHLVRVLERLPRDLRFRVMDLDIGPGLIRIDGQARTHADAERVALALGEGGGYAVEPPKTQSLRGGGVSFLFSARPEQGDGAGAGPGGEGP